MTIQRTPGVASVGRFVKANEFCVRLALALSDQEVKVINRRGLWDYILIPEIAPIPCTPPLRLTILTESGRRTTQALTIRDLHEGATILEGSVPLSMSLLLLLGDETLASLNEYLRDDIEAQRLEPEETPLTKPSTTDAIVPELLKPLGAVTSLNLLVGFFLNGAFVTTLIYLVASEFPRFFSFAPQTAPARTFSAIAHDAVVVFSPSLFFLAGWYMTTKIMNRLMGLNRLFVFALGQALATIMALLPALTLTQVLLRDYLRGHPSQSPIAHWYVKTSNPSAGDTTTMKTLISSAAVFGMLFLITFTIALPIGIARLRRRHSAKLSLAGRG